MTDSRLRFGLIGTGVWARVLQAPAAARSQAVRFTAVLGRNPAATQDIAATHGVAAHTELAAFLDCVDIVGIAVPPTIQPDFALAAIAAGKHVLLEKPVATDPAKADAIVAALAAQRLQSLVFFTQLLIPRFQSWIASAAESGPWTAARVDSFSRLLLDPANPFHETAWRADGGALWDTGPHAVALLTTILGPVETVSAVQGQRDLKIVTLTHRGGALSTISLTMNAPAPFPGETALYGASGKSVLPPASVDWFTEAGEGYSVALQTLADAIAGRPTAPFPDARFGAGVTKVLAAAERSIADGRHISLL